MVDVYPPDYATDVGKVRALIPDVEQVDFSGEGAAEYIFSDEHLEALIGLARGTGRAQLYRAAAHALRDIAVSEVMISKVVRTEDLQTDGAKVANSLLAAARNLEDRADDDEEDEDDRYAFSVVDFQPQPPESLPYTLRGYPYGYNGSSADRGAGFGSGVV